MMDKISDKSLTMHCRVRLWLETDQGFVLGPGQAEILRRIHQMGSLRKAAASMNMSYRRAWGRLKRSERQLGRDLVCKTGGNKSGYQLTDFGMSLLDGFLKLTDDLDALLQEKAGKAFDDRIVIDQCLPVDNKKAKD